MMITLAFALKAILPVGFMPVVNKDGFTQIVICSGIEEKTITVPSDKGPASGHHEDGKADKVCAYQVLSSGKIILFPPILAIDTPVMPHAVVEISKENPLPSNTNFSFTARGPPSA